MLLQEKSKPIEPYRFLFPVGIVSGLWGVMLWILFGTGLIESYPLLAHPDIMVGGFLFAFVAGFLMTAVPRFTGTFSARLWEVGAAAIFALLVPILAGVDLWHPSARGIVFFLLLLQGVWLSLFCVRRFACRTHSPPASFLFVGIGLFCAVFGPLFLFLADRGWASVEVALLGKALFYHGMVLALVVGIGSRLIPAFWGFSAQPLVQLLQQGKNPAQAKVELKEMGLLALSFLISFPLEIWGNAIAGRALRAAIVTYLLFTRWKAHQKPITRGELSTWLRVCVFALVLGLWVYALLPNFAVHAAHLIFIGGFSLLVILIASRVTLSHGGHDMSIERRTHVFRWAGTLFLISAILRFIAPLTGIAYLSLLVAAASVWIAALLIWSFFYQRYQSK